MALYAAAYVNASVTQIHRPYQTLLGSQPATRLARPVAGPHRPGSRLRGRSSGRAAAEVVADLLRTSPHTGAGTRPFPPSTATRCPRPSGQTTATTVIWTFSLNPATARYVFNQVPRTTFGRRHRYGDLSL